MDRRRSADAPIKRTPQEKLYCRKKKISHTMQCNAELFVVENKLYGDVIELQFINVKSEPTNQIPWEVDL